MAENRMYLRCKGCGAEMMLGKLLGGAWYFAKTDEEKGRELSEFMLKHGGCCKGLEDDTCGGISPYHPDFEPFELVYENRDEWGHQQTLQDKDKELHPDNYEAIP